MNRIQYRIKLLGKPSLELVDGSLISIRKKCRGILFFLAGQAEPVSREKIQTIFFPHGSIAAAKHNLNVHFSEISRLLPGILKNDSGYLELAQCVEVDFRIFLLQMSSVGQRSAELFENTQLLDNIVKASPGEFMDGFSLQGLPDFDDWLQIQRNKLHATYVNLLSAAAQRYYAQGDYSGSATALEHAILLDPYDEYLYQNLMRVYAQSGNPIKASKTYDRIRELLLTELGVSPMPVTQELYNSILFNANSDEELLNYKPEGITPVRYPTPLVGRQQQLKVCEKITSSGQGGVVIVESSPGVGRTVFLNYMQKQYRGMTATLVCSETYGDPLYPLKRMMLHFQEQDKTLLQRMRKQFGEKMWQYLIAFVPSFSAPRDGKLIEQSLTLEQTLELTLAFIRFILDNKKIMIAIDDIEDALPPLLDICGAILKELSVSGVLFLVAKNSEQPVPFIENTVRQLSSHCLTNRIYLPCLTKEETQKLVEQKINGKITHVPLEWLYSRTKGNAKALCDYIDYLLSTPTDEKKIQELCNSDFVPDTFSMYIASVLHKMPNLSRELLRYASVYGKVFYAPTIREAMECPQMAFIDALEVVLQDGFVKKVDGNTYRFDYPILADAVYQDISLIRRQYMHKRIAKAMQIQEDLFNDSTQREVVSHFIQSDSLADGISCCLKYVDSAIDTGEWQKTHFFLLLLKKYSPLNHALFSMEKFLICGQVDQAREIAKAGAALPLKDQKKGSVELFRIVVALTAWKPFSEFFSGNIIDQSSVSPNCEPTLQETMDAAILFSINSQGCTLSSPILAKIRLCCGIYLYLQRRFAEAEELLEPLCRCEKKESETFITRTVSLAQLIRTLCLWKLNSEKTNQSFITGVVYTRNHSLLCMLPFYETAHKQIKSIPDFV